MDTDPNPSPHGDSNRANIGNGAHVKQFAQGSNITQIEGYTAGQVRMLIDNLRASFQPKLFDGRSPYVGLASFQEQDADRFFGREKLTQELVARIAQTRFLVIAGPSGSGKSSLARAGFIHALRGGVQLNAPTLDGSENWLYEILTPGRHPLEQLARLVSSFAKSTNAGDEIQQRGRDDATLLHRWADIALGDQKTRRAILLVDQFEESFTQVAEAQERAAFLNLLTYAATVENGRVTIVICTRSDFIGNWAAYPNLNAQLRHGITQIPPMQPDELVSAIARPAIQVGLPIDETLVKQILDDMRDAPGALPLMQFALDDLFEYEKSKGGVIALTRDAYLERGGLHQALARHADAEFARLNPSEKEIARSIFARLIEPGRGSVDTKRTALFSELVSSSADAAQVKTVVIRLADARLVTTDTANERETVTLAHERLIDAWGWLRRLVDENREAIALQNQINDDAQEWEQHGRDASYLYGGARLATAHEQAADKKIVLSASAQEFVAAGIVTRETDKRKTAERTRRLIIAFGAAAAIFAVLAIVAFLFQQQAEIQRVEADNAKSTAEARRIEAESAQGTAETRRIEAEHQQKIARSRELAALAQSQFDTNPDLAILIAIEANKEADAATFEAEDVLRQLLIKYPLEFALRGHNAPVTDTQFSPDGKKIVTAGDDGTARMWDAASGKQLAVLRGHTDRVNRATFSSDGAQILTAGADGTVRVWNAENGTERTNWSTHPGGILDAQFSPDGKKILTTGCDKFYGQCLVSTTRLWDAIDGHELGVLHERKNDVATGQFSPDGKFIVTAGCDRQTQDACEKTSVRLWDATGSRELAVLDEQIVFAAAVFSPDGNKILTIGCEGPNQITSRCRENGIAQVWDVNTWLATSEITASAVLRLPMRHIENAQFSPDSRKLVITTNDRIVRVWEIGSNQEPIGMAHDQSVGDARFSPDGHEIVTIDYDLVRLWDSNGTPLALLRGHTDSIWQARFSPDGNKILTASADGTVRLWNITAPQDAASGKELAVLNKHSDSVMRAQFSPDGKEIVTASYDKTARIWDATNFAEIHILGGHEDRVLDAEFSADGKQILTVSFDQTARIWDAISGRQRAVLHLKAQGSTFSARFSPDGKQIVTAGDDGLAYVWDTVALLATGSEQLLTVLNRHIDMALSANYSPDGKQIVTTGWDGSARVWDATSGKTLVPLWGHEGSVSNAQFSFDGKRIVTASADDTARIWDAVTGEQIVVLRGHDNAVNSARFSPDGSKIVTASTDHTARIWDLASGKILTILRGHASEVWDAEFSPDGENIITAGGDGTARVFLVHARDLVKLAHTRVGRELTCEEREQYLNEQNVCPMPTAQASPTP